MPVRSTQTGGRKQIFYFSTLDTPNLVAAIPHYGSYKGKCYPGRFSIDCGDWFAWASIAVPACEIIWFFVKY
jgi:hypothetical protein